MINNFRTLWKVSIKEEMSLFSLNDYGATKEDSNQNWNIVNLTIKCLNQNIDFFSENESNESYVLEYKVLLKSRLLALSEEISIWTNVQRFYEMKTDKRQQHHHHCIPSNFIKINKAKFCYRQIQAETKEPASWRNTGNSTKTNPLTLNKSYITKIVLTSL